MLQSSSEKYNEKFEEILSRLNQEQLTAVNKMDGPVLVVAGPGTGKTQILAARIGKILLETDAKPNEILCLTYTDAGAVAMRKRLSDFIGPDAYRINIYTFHAFCNDIIQENLEYFGKMSLEPLTDLESAILFRELIDDFGNDHLLKRYTGDIYFDAPRLKALFSTMKRENWTVNLIEQAIDDYLNDLPNREAFIYKKANAARGIQKGDVKQKDIDAAKEVMNKLRCAVNEFAVYEAKMKQRSRYDYDDMIIWVLKAFREQENLLRRYQERHQHILVDEFQDTSGSQNELLKFLLQYWDTPNVFVVGDDDQSIFRFQGANMKNILDFAGDYVDTLLTVVLKSNYRSNQTILDISKVLIDNNRERLTSQLKLDKKLLSAHPRFTAEIAEPVINQYTSIDQELADISGQIKQLLDKGTQANEIAVIYRNHNQVEQLIHHLDMQHIAVNTKRKIDIFTLPFGEKIINIMQYLAMELDSPYSGDELLFEIMHYNFFEIPPIEIAKASIAVSKKNYSLSQDESKTSIRRYVSEMRPAAQISMFDASQGQEMRQLITDISFLLKASASLSLQQLFQQVITALGILRYVMQQPDKGWHMDVLNSLFNFVRDEARKTPDTKLKNIMATVDLMKKNNIRLELNQVIQTEGGINFLTAHGSKGLEFEHVFLLGCTKRIWDDKGRNTGFSFPDTLMQAPADESSQEESRRLFYVALTRAKQCLYISYATHDSKGKEQEASQFISEILAETHLQPVQPQVSQEVMMNYMAAQFSEADKPVVELLDRNYINQLLQNYVLSVTHLNSYLDCPLKFYFQNLIRVPAGKSPAMAFGSAVHHALHKVFVRLKANDDRFPPVEEFMREFHGFMFRNRDAFTSEEFRLRMDYGNKILPAFYQQNIPQWNKIVMVELPVRNQAIKGVPVKGHLDKVEFTGKLATIVDYKTGKLKYAKEKMQRPGERFPNGGDYWRQAVFYKMLLDNDRKDWQVTSVVFDFIEPVNNEYYKEKIVVTPEDIDVVTGQLTATYQKIMNHEFATGCGKPECDWCHFVRSNFKQPGKILEMHESVD